MALELSIGIHQADNCKSFTLSDTTGAYVALTNVGGHGSPNPAIADADTATLAVTLFGSATTYTKSVFSTLPTTTTTTEFTINNTDLGLASTATIPDGIYLLRYTVSGGFTITAVNTGTKTFTVSGDKSTTFAVGDTFTILGSTGNDGTYTVTAISFSTPNTLITVSETVPSAIADGKVRYTAYTTQYEMFFCNGQACLHNALQGINATECEDCNNTKIAFIAKLNTFILATKYAASCGKVNKAAALLDYLTELCALTSCSNCD